MEKFERLIEYVINDEEAKARELFHEIVVEKSRDIYENLMADEELGGDSADDFIDDIESEEEGSSLDFDAEMGMDDESGVELDFDSEDDLGDDSESDDAAEEVEELEDRVVGVEDKLDELMAEFESLMSAEEGVVADEEGEEAEDGDDAESEEGEEESEEDEEMLSLDEALELQAAPKPKTSEESFVHSKSTVAANSGAKGSEAKPSELGNGDEKGRSAPTAKDMGHTTHIDKLSKGPSTTDSEPSEVNTKSTLG